MTLYLPSTNRSQAITRESFVQSHGSPQIFTLLDGRVVENRNGCLVDQATRRVITKSTETKDYLLNHGLLTAEQREFVFEWGDAVFGPSAKTGMGASGITHNKV